MSTTLRNLLGLAVLINVALVVWLLVRQPAGEGGNDAPIFEPLVATETLSATRYDLSGRADELNVVLISLDALRYDRTGFSGREGESLTPNLDALAQESVVFHDATTAAPWTLPSHMSVWTGRWPSVHGVTNKLKLLAQDQMVPTSLSAGIESFPDALIRQGYTAVGFTGGAGVQGRYGFGRGFDTYLDDRYFGGLDYSMPAALEWVDDNREQRFFMFLHGYDSHGQFPLPAGSLELARQGYTGPLKGDIEENARLRELGLEAIQEPGDAPDLTQELSAADADFLKAVYDRKVRDADARVGTFINRLKALGLLDRTVIIVMSDHGEEFMEHGAVDHGATLYQEMVHSVLLMRVPGFVGRNDVQAPVRLLDVFPTVFDLMGLEGPEGVDGRSLLPLMRGERLELPVHSESDYRLFVHMRMIRDGDKKLILDLEDGQRELYDLGADPGELKDVSSQDPRATYELEQGLRGWMEDASTNPEDYLGIREQPIKIF